MDAIFERGVVALDELLDLDNVILKTRNGDERLLAFITRREVLARLVEYAVGHGLEQEKALRYPLIACELLCCEQPPVWTAMQRHSPDILLPLWRFIESPAPIPAPLAVCWSRVLLVLLHKMPAETASSLRSRPRVPAALVCHLATPAIAESVYRLMTVRAAPEAPKGAPPSPQAQPETQEDAGLQDRPFPPASPLPAETSPLPPPLPAFDGLPLLAWLEGNSLLGMILGRVSVDFDCDAHLAAQHFLAGLFSFPFDDSFPLAALFGRIVDRSGAFLERTLAPPPEASILSTASDILSDLIRVVIAKAAETQAESSGRGAESATEDWVGLRGRIATVFIPHLKSLHPILGGGERDAPTYKSPGGAIVPVGICRLKAARLFADVLLLQSGELAEEVRRLGVANSLLELFFSHPTNNLLHSAVEDFIRNVFSGRLGENRELILSLFREGQITSRILKTQRINDGAVYCARAGLAWLTDRQRPRGNRLNHMGHITLISDEIFKFLEAHGDEMSALLGEHVGHEEWAEYRELSHRETKIRDGTVLGGTKAPPPPSEELGSAGTATFNSIFSAGSDEQLARYFCQQVIANLPSRFAFSEEGDEGASDDDEGGTSYYEDIAAGSEAGRQRESGAGASCRGEGGEVYSEDHRRDTFSFDYSYGYNYEGAGMFEEAPSIKIPFEPNGFDTLLEMEMRSSSLGDIPDDYGEGDSASDPEDAEDSAAAAARSPGREHGHGRGPA